MSYREVIQHWFLSIEEAAKADLTPKDYNELRNAVLYGDAMDKQILDATKRFPQVWHIAMILVFHENVQGVFFAFSSGKVLGRFFTFSRPPSTLRKRKKKRKRTRNKKKMQCWLESMC